MEEALHIALVGMGYVFFFLALLILILSATSYVLRRFFVADASLVVPKYGKIDAEAATQLVKGGINRENDKTDTLPISDTTRLSVAVAALEHHIKTQGPAQ